MPVISLVSSHGRVCLSHAAVVEPAFLLPANQERLLGPKGHRPKGRTALRRRRTLTAVSRICNLNGQVGRWRWPQSDGSGDARRAISNISVAISLHRPRTAPACSVVACLLRNGFGIVAVAFFAVGIWLYCGRHHVSRYADPGLFRASMAVGLYSLGRWAVDLINVSNTDQIELPYFALLAFLPFVPVGLVLVREPLDALVKGCRVAIIAAAVVGAYHLAIGPSVTASARTS